MILPMKQLPFPARSHRATVRFADRSDEHTAFTGSLRGVLTPAATLLLWMAAGCTTDSTSNPPILVQDSAGVTVVTNDLEQLSATCALSSEPTLTIGTMEGAPEYQLYRVFGARHLSDGRIVLVDQGSQELRFYDSEGRFLNAAGQRGNGPGEFQNAFHLWVLPGDTVWVGDYAPWEFEVFGPDGTWVRSIRPTPDYVNSPAVLAVLQDGRSVLAEQRFFEAPVNRFDPQFLTVVLHRSDGTLADTLGSYPNGSRGRFEEWPSFVAAPMFESSARVTASGSRIFVGHTSKPEIQIFEVDGEGQARLDLIVRWTAEMQQVTSADVEAERRRIAEPFEDMDAALRQQLLEPQLNERRPVASTFPVFAALNSGRDGRVWVRTFRRPGTDGLNEWLVFGPDGGLQCRVWMPSFAQMTEFGSDYLLVLNRDDLGVERVLRYALTAPGEGL